jgi:hypothetical protein
MDDLRQQLTLGARPRIGSRLASLTAVTLLAGLVVTTAGCGTTAEFFGQDKHHVEKPAYSDVVEIADSWVPQAMFLPDTQQGGIKKPALVGQLIMVSGQDGSSFARGKGKVVVSLYDADAPAFPGQQPVETWTIDKDNLDRMLKPDQFGLWSYNLTLPWGSYRPDRCHLRMKIEFDQENKAPVYSDERVVTLNTTPPDLRIQQTTRLSQPYADPALLLAASRNNPPANAVVPAGYPNVPPGQAPQGYQASYPGLPQQGTGNTMAPAGVQGGAGQVTFPISVPIGGYPGASNPGNFGNILPQQPGLLPPQQLQAQPQQGMLQQHPGVMPPQQFAAPGQQPQAPVQQVGSPSNNIIMAHIGQPDLRMPAPPGSPSGGVVPQQMGQPYVAPGMIPNLAQPSQAPANLPQALPAQQPVAKPLETPSVLVNPALPQAGQSAQGQDGAVYPLVIQ